jgi:hypothetical protein
MEKNNYMKNFLEWLKNIHSAGRPESAKRFYGAIGFITAIVYIAIWDHDSIVTLLYVSAGLLGLETITQIFTKKKFGKETGINDTSEVNNEGVANEPALPPEESVKTDKNV